jgi:hypothetical protein
MSWRETFDTMLEATREIAALHIDECTQPEERRLVLAMRTTLAIYDGEALAAQVPQEDTGKPGSEPDSK